MDRPEAVQYWMTDAAKDGLYMITKASDADAVLAYIEQLEARVAELENGNP